MLRRLAPSSGFMMTGCKPARRARSMALLEARFKAASAPMKSGSFAVRAETRGLRDGMSAKPDALLDAADGEPDIRQL
jgi:hypothetical protein